MHHLRKTSAVIEIDTFLMAPPLDGAPRGVKGTREIVKCQGGDSESTIQYALEVVGRFSNFPRNVKLLFVLGW